MTVFFKVSFFSIEEASDFEAKVNSLTGIESLDIQDWTGSDARTKRGHSPEVHSLYEFEKQSLNSFESLISQLQGVRVIKDDDDDADKIIIIESIAPRHREQHREWCNLSEEEYTDKFGSPEDQEEWESRTMDAWFGTPNWGLPEPCFFDSNGIAI